jgi:hypothetical protein
LQVPRVGIGWMCVGTWTQCSAIMVKNSSNGIWKRNRFSTVWVLFKFHRHTLVEFAGFSYKFCSFLTLTWINKWTDKTCKGFMGISVLAFLYIRVWKSQACWFSSRPSHSTRFLVCLRNFKSYLFHVNIYCLMLFIIDNLNNFRKGLEIHGLPTRSKNRLFISIANLTMFKKELPGMVLKSITVCPSIF